MGLEVQRALSNQYFLEGRFHPRGPSTLSALSGRRDLGGQEGLAGPRVRSGREDPVDQEDLVDRGGRGGQLGLSSLHLLVVPGDPEDPVDPEGRGFLECPLGHWGLLVLTDLLDRAGRGFLECPLGQWVQ
jgi:hypothetical protein